MINTIRWQHRLLSFFVTKNVRSGGTRWVQCLGQFFEQQIGEIEEHLSLYGINVSFIALFIQLKILSQNSLTNREYLSVSTI